MGLGFVFWGVFIAYGLVVVGYLIWMYLIESAGGD